MHSFQPGHSDQWPQDMAITIDNSSGKLMFLLFVREAWNIENVDLPGINPIPDIGGSARPVNVENDELLNEWDTAWAHAVADLSFDRVPHPVDSAAQARLDAMSIEELLAIDDPCRAGIFANGVDLEAYGAWDWSTKSLPNPTSFEDQPERRNLAELVPAWGAGLRKVTELPFAGDWARRINIPHLLVSTHSRFDRQSYGRALSLPVEPAR
jgi:hypothetical protein